jgi:curved DNA-binding protein CbpA
MIRDIDPYRVLDVDRTASEAAIREAYRALARRFHPDVADDPETQNRMVRINAAWELLGDAGRRARWDDANRRPMSPHGVSGASEDIIHAPTYGEYEPAGRAWHPRTPPGTGAAGFPPGRPSGSVLAFGRHLGWSLGEIARVDPGYLLWLESMPEGRPYGAELDGILRRLGARQSDLGPAAPRRFGLS